MVLYQINVEANYGSTGKIAEALGQMVQQNQGKAFLAHGRKYRDSSLSTYKVGNTWSYAFHYLISILFDGQGRGSYFATKRLVSHIKNTQPDIIHLHNIHGYYVNYKILFKYLQEFKGAVVWTLHDCWALTGHCTHYDHVGCEKWKTNCNSCPQTNKYPSSIGLDNSYYNHIEKKRSFLMPSNMHIVTVSKWLKKQVKQSYLSQRNIQTIHNGLNTTIFKKTINDELRVKYKLKNNFLILGVASVWDSNKGLNDFIKLSQNLQKMDKIVLIGLSKTQISQLPNGIIGIERTDSLKTLIAWYTTADVYFNASYEESFGMTTIEAMACGTPVIVYNATACAESVTDKVGFRVIKKDVNAINKSLDEIRIKKSIYYENYCRTHVLENFDQRDRFNDYIELYQNILAEKL
jgi:putative colanic acid biosynthesis glycosyltransferase